MTRISALATVLLSMLIASAWAAPSASAAVTSPLPIPAKVTAGNALLSMTVTKGKVVKVTIKNTRKGNAFLAKLRKGLTVSCSGLDAANTTSYTLTTPDTKWRGRSRVATFKLTVPIIVDVCGVGTDLFGMKPVPFRAIDVVNERPGPAPSPHYASQFTTLTKLTSQSFGASISLAFDGIEKPTPQQLVDAIAKETSYQPPLPLIAATSRTSFPDAASLAVWTSTTELASLMVDPADGTQLADRWLFAGMK